MDSAEVGAELADLQDTIAMEEEKSRRYRIENARRRHNYTPFIVELLKLLAKEGKLVPLVEKALQEATAKKSKDGNAKTKAQA